MFASDDKVLIFALQVDRMWLYEKLRANFPEEAKECSFSKPKETSGST